MVSFFDTRVPDVQELAEAVSEVCVAAGALLERGDKALAKVDVAEESDEISTTVRLNGVDIRTRIYGQPKGTIPNPFLSLSTDANNLFPDTAPEDVGYTGFPANFLDLLTCLAEAVDPVIVSSFSTAHVSAGPSPKMVTPTEVPIDLDRVPWLGVYSEQITEQLGGRERVLDTPAWTVEELDNGSILVVTTREPWDGYESKHPADRFLLDGDDLCEE